LIIKISVHSISYNLRIDIILMQLLPPDLFEIAFLD